MATTDPVVANRATLTVSLGDYGNHACRVPNEIVVGSYFRFRINPGKVGVSCFEVTSASSGSITAAPAESVPKHAKVHEIEDLNRA
jgi:hypothetical protein